MTEGFDIELISETLAGDDTLEKIRMLEALESQLPDWDIFPVSMLLPGLDDPDSTVRGLTFSLLSYCKERLTQDDLLKILNLIGVGDVEVRRLAVEMVSVFSTCIRSDTLRRVVPYLWHRDGEVRETAIEVFTSISYQFTDEMFMAVAEKYGSEGMNVRESIAEFLERNGQECLINV